MSGIDALTDIVPGAGPAAPTAPHAIADAVARARYQLESIAFDLQWSWHPEARRLFVDLDRDAWAASGHNPVWLLGRLPAERLEAQLGRGDYAGRLDEVSADFAARRAGGAWSPQHHPGLGPGVALFSAEFALADCLPISVGGLGAVAGEHLKTSSALGVPVTGVGLLYGEASHQWLDPRGGQHETWEPFVTADRPLRPVHGPMQFPLELRVPLPDGSVRVRVWQAAVEHSRLLLLDTAVAGNLGAHREITRRIYPSDPETRLRQYLVLGIAGYRALVALGLEPRVLHCNEGHTALAALARVAALMERHGLSFDEARLAAAPGIVFTTHTPVPAGHDYFAPAMAAADVQPVAEELGIDPDALLALGRHDPDVTDDTFCPTVLAMRLAGHRNGVSELHGAVARHMWRGLWPRVPIHEIPIGHVTNGVHLPSWAASEMAEVLSEALGAGVEGAGDTPLPWSAVRDVPAEPLWVARTAQRARLVGRARAWLALQGVRRAGGAATALDPDARLDPDALTIGFVGRFVAYKRPTLFLRDRERLARILADDERPVQIVFAGRAHPTDYAGKALLREVVSFARREGLSHRLVFLEDFDIAMDHWLSQGVDVWLNTPRRPDEACGIAGMKAGINGALNFSTVDGWWDQAWRESEVGQTPIGWAIGGRQEFTDIAAQDAYDVWSLYDVLEHEVVPAFYDRGVDGVPHGWVAMMRESIATLGDLWTSSRMVREYADAYYGPGASRGAQLTARRAVRARRAAQYLERLRDAWPGVRVTAVGTRPAADGQVRIVATVALGGLKPRDVAVEAWLDVPGEPARAGLAPPLSPAPRGDSSRRAFDIVLDARRLPAGTEVAARVVPRAEMLDDPLSAGLIAWSD